MTGVVIGFLLSIWIHRIEVNHDLRKEKQKEKGKKVATIKHIMLSCASNVETLINYKRQIVLPLIGEIEIIKPLVIGGDFPAAAKSLEKMLSMFHAVPTVSRVALPSQDDFLLIADDIPMIIAYYSRFQEAMENVNAMATERNKYIEQFSAKNVEGMNERALSYYLMMLISTGENLKTLVDDALFFGVLLSDQIANYSENKFKDVKTIKFTIDNQHAVHLPPKDYVKGFREQFHDFSKDPVERSIFTLADSYSTRSI
ncbi:hypothetical protein [Mesorhizobium sp. CO1-1-9]|uniref:hypothetical protein n=1 Tax=Mesorhizobium sp. CO1-1-9 TaxID=2876630 RepID=UPI001CCDB2B3|nr:hypothetical protein [Mesorhizobium sp. CO1-1-9]MBZ9694533.1 hypothetical protein [Mesorhizobium sp. CO1-1-9]